MSEQSSFLNCNNDQGFCETSNDKVNTSQKVLINKNTKPVKVIYFTDPICSSCWGIEPQLRKLKLEYGNLVEFEYRMGGLLPDWSYNSGGISKPSDVATHWDEVSVYYDMPIDGNVWLEDPLSSSFPPSIAFKAAQIQSEEKSILFLRKIREMVFLEKRNISKLDFLEIAAKNVGLDLEKFKVDYHGKANELFESDLKLGTQLGVRGFPTMFFLDKSGNQKTIYGLKPYHLYENVLLQMVPKAVKRNYDKSWQYAFEKFSTLTAKEFSELTDINRKETDKLLQNLTLEGKLEETTTKNGSIWKVKKK